MVTILISTALTDAATTRGNTVSMSHPIYFEEANPFAWLFAVESVLRAKLEISS